MQKMWNSSCTENIAQHLEKICQKCKNRNHFASQCLSKNAHFLESDQAPQPVVEDEQLEELFIGQIQKDDHVQEWKASLQVNNNLVEFKLDTGAQANVIPLDAATEDN